MTWALWLLVQLHLDLLPSSGMLCRIIKYPFLISMGKMDNMVKMIWFSSNHRKSQQILPLNVLYVLKIPPRSPWLILPYPCHPLGKVCACACMSLSPRRYCAAICWCSRSSWRWWCRIPAWCPWLLCSRRWWWCGSAPVPLCPCRDAYGQTLSLLVNPHKAMHSKSFKH